MTTVWVTFQQEGWHCWPHAPKERAYLGAEHRHMFHFRVEVAVEHNNRNIELHDLRGLAIDHLAGEFSTSDWSVSGLDFEGNSCEMIANNMARFILDHFNAKWAACEVSEDGECGARVEVRA